MNTAIARILIKSTSYFCGSLKMAQIKMPASTSNNACHQHYGEEQHYCQVRETHRRQSLCTVPFLCFLIGLLLFVGISALYFRERQFSSMKAEIVDMRTEIEELREDVMEATLNAKVMYDNEEEQEEEDYVLLSNYEDEKEEEEEEEEEVAEEVEELFNGLLNAEEMASVRANAIQNGGAQRRLKRGASTSTASPGSGKTKNKKSKKDRKKKKGRRLRGSKQGRRSAPQVEAFHLIPTRHPDKMQQVANGESPNVNCGTLTRHGVKVNCETANFWEVDRHTSAPETSMSLANGVVVIKRPGLYYIYSQMTHHDTLGSWSYAVNRTKSNGHTGMIVQCPGMEPHFHSSSNTERVYPVQFQCHTSLAVRLEMNDKISILNMYFDQENRVVKLDKHLTFWGLIRLSD